MGSSDSDTRTLIIHPDKCVGCGICELACSMEKEHEYLPSKARIKVFYRYPPACLPIVCINCRKPPCADICMHHATRRDKRTGAIVVDKWECMGCGKCIVHCPWGAIKFLPDRVLAIRCDLCEGTPQCVKFCPTAAIEYTSPNEIARKSMNKMITKISKLP